MSCPAPEQLAAAASGEAPAVVAHAATCERCSGVVDEQRELIALARRLPVPSLPSARRSELAAEVMAHSDVVAARGRSRWVVVAGALAAAALAIVIARRPVAPEAVVLAVPASTEASQPTVALAEHERAPDPVVATAELVRISDGELAIDARDRAPITVVVGDTRVVVRAKATIVARDGVIVSARVFAGSAEIATAGRVLVIEAGDVWTRPSSDDSLRAFRTGWEALRGRQYREAIAQFDRAIDDVVAEDAAFWAAIAAERAGDLAAARQRLRRFLEKFPASPRVESARSALERVTR